MQKANRSWHNLIILQNARNSEIFLVPTSLGSAGQTSSTLQTAFLREKLTSAGTRHVYTKKAEQNGTAARLEEKVTLVYGYFVTRGIGHLIQNKRSSVQLTIKYSGDLDTW